MSRAAPLMPVTEALARVLRTLDQVRPAVCRGRALSDCYNRVLAEDLIAKNAVPSHTNAALDGYALRAADLPSDAPRSYPVAGSAFAGRPFEGALPEGAVLQVMTGAVLPALADTVVPWEQVEIQEQEQQVQIGTGHHAHQNVRRAGEDITAGATVIRTGVRLFAPELGIAASLGIANVAVFAAPLATLLSTGDELRKPGDEPSSTAGLVYDSNHFLLQGFLQRLGVQVQDGGLARDHAGAVEEALQHAAANSDLVLISGGASRGAADFVIEALKKLGHLELSGIALRPGRPFGFGVINRKPIFVLPGNPVAVATTFLFLVAPAIRKMMGEKDLSPPQPLQARCTAPFPKKPNRMDVYRARLEYDKQGNPTVSPAPQQGSGMLLSLAQSNCLVVLPHDDPPADAGDWVTVYPYHGLL